MLEYILKAGDRVRIPLFSMNKNIISVEEVPTGT